jgi:hypothetical protein
MEQKRVFPDTFKPAHVFCWFVLQKGLLRMHSMHNGLRRRYRLAEQAAIIHEMDMAIVREGGASQLSQEELRLVMMMKSN